MIYADTDSIKLTTGYNKEIIENYNKKVIEKLKKVSEDLEISFSKFAPKDIKGNEHCLGLFEKEYTSKINKNFTYKEFKTEGAKKYCYRTMKFYKKIFFTIPNKKHKYFYKILTDEVRITVSGVPKKRSSRFKKWP